MTIFNEARGRVIDANPSPIFRLVGLAIAAFLIVILLFSSITRVESGHVGVLTLFGRVTGEILPEGIHLINPFKSSTEMSIRTQEIKESASVPSAEGLVMNLDTSLIYHLDPAKAPRSTRRLGQTTWSCSLSRTCAQQFARRPLRTPPTLYTAESASWWPNRFATNSRRYSDSVEF